MHHQGFWWNLIHSFLLSRYEAMQDFSSPDITVLDVRGIELSKSPFSHSTTFWAYFYVKCDFKIPWITQEGLPQCNAVGKARCCFRTIFYSSKCVFWFTSVFSGKFSNIKIYYYTCDLNMNVIHNVYSNKCSIL